MKLKAIKSPEMIEGMSNANIRDCAALVKYFAWLKRQLDEEEEVTEFTGAKQLAEFRKEGDLFKSLSFPAISSIGANGAIVHYSPTEESAKAITNKEMYLLDSGGQYLDGTTDITRTLHFGEAKPEEKQMYTRVLLGNLDLER